MVLEHQQIHLSSGGKAQLMVTSGAILAKTVLPPPLFPRTISPVNVQCGIMFAAEWDRHVAGVP